MVRFLSVSLVLLAVIVPLTGNDPSVLAQTDDKPAADAPKPAVEQNPPDTGDAGPDAESSPSVEPSPPPKPPPYRVKPAPDSGASTIGSLDPAEAKLQVELSAYGAGINRALAAGQYRTVEKEDHYQIIAALEGRKAGGDVEFYQFPFGARTLTISRKTGEGDAAQWTDHSIDLAASKWRQAGAGAYTAEIIDGEGNDVLRITRTYTLGEGDAGWTINCRTEFVNLCGDGLKLTWRQNALGDVPVDEESDTGHDLRQIVAGYYDLEYDPGKVRVYTDDARLDRRALVEDYTEDGRRTLWPMEDAPSPSELVWIGMTNRYFAAAAYLPGTVTAAESERATAPPLTGIFDAHVGVELGGEAAALGQQVLIFTLNAKPFTLAPRGQEGAAHAFDLALYAGPRDGKILSHAPYDVLHFEELVTYERSCTICFFQPLADFLLWFLTIIHAVVRDWAVAIIILVLVVRTLLHPITKRAQVNMVKMSKQMGKLQPEMQKIKEKYKTDQQRQQQEMMKLYREHGVNPAGFLGCLPMFLQMPIWIALYAMLFGAYALRHQEGFYGIFQVFGEWQFLADLSTADHFIRFAEGGFHMPLCEAIYIPYALNILPLLMAVMFYFQQKFTTPPPANEQQAQQQKMMKWMTLMFPIFLYGAPSGLTLYILASSSIGMVESYYVRKHIKEKEESGELFKKKERKPGGFMDRLSKAMEAKQQQMQEREKALRGGKRPGASKRKKRKR